MKISIVITLLLAGMATLRAQTSISSQTDAPVPTAYQVVKQDGNYNIWQREEYEKGPNGVAIPHVRSTPSSSARKTMSIISAIAGTTAT